MNVILNHPNSQGWVRLKSGNPEDHPRFSTNMLSAPEDRERMLAGLRQLIEIVKNSKFADEIEDYGYRCLFFLF